jgi:hypothetical protein
VSSLVPFLIGPYAPVGYSQQSLASGDHDFVPQTVIAVDYAQRGGRAPTVMVRPQQLGGFS